MAANYSGLASELNLPEKDSADQTLIIAAVKRWLGDNRKWLLIFDNVKVPQDIGNYLPREGRGHVIITSRNPNWGGVAGEIPLRFFKRDESVAFLCRRTKQESKEDAFELADSLGDLPLALEQAGAYIQETAISLSDYLKLFSEHRQKILERGKPAGYPDTVATTWDLSFEAVQRDFPVAIDLLRLLAFLAPDGIPKSILIEGASDLPEPLSTAAKDGVKFNDSVAALRRYSLISVSDDSLSVHRLVQAVMQDRLAIDEKKKWAEAALKIVNEAFPFDSDDVRTWPICSSLLPHASAAAKSADKLEVAQEAIVRLLNQMGSYQKGRAEFLEAKKNYERALEIGLKVYGPDHPIVAACLNNLGRVLKDLGDLQGAKKNYERALEIDLKVYGPDHSEVAIFANNLGAVLRDLGDLQGAKKNYERALEIDLKVYGPDHPDVAIRLNNLGGVLKDLGDLQGAKKNFERALEIGLKAYGPDHPDVAIRLNNLGGVLKDLGDLQGAKKNFERALEIDLKVYGPDHPDVAIDLNNLGGVLEDLGDLQGAKKNFEQALSIFQSNLGEDHSKTRTVRENLRTLENRS